MLKYIQIFFVMAFVSLLSSTLFSADTVESCSKKDAQKAEELADTAKSWDDLYRLYKRYHQCDDGAIAEGFSESVSILLSHSWEQIDKLNKIVVKDNKFKLFVLKHIDETVPQERLQEIAYLATNKCSSATKSLCEKIRKRVNELNE